MVPSIRTSTCACGVSAKVSCPGEISSSIFGVSLSGWTAKSSDCEVCQSPVKVGGPGHGPRSSKCSFGPYRGSGAPGRWSTRENGFGCRSPGWNTHDACAAGAFSSGYASCTTMSCVPERGEIAERTDRHVQAIPEGARVLRLDHMGTGAEAGQQPLGCGGAFFCACFAPVELQRLQLFLLDVAKRELQLQGEGRIAAATRAPAARTRALRDAVEGVGRDAQLVGQRAGDRGVLERILQRACRAPWRPRSRAARRSCCAAG